MTMIEVNPEPIPDPPIYTCVPLVRQIRDIVGGMLTETQDAMLVDYNVADEIMNLPVMQALLKEANDAMRARRIAEMREEAQRQFFRDEALRQLDAIMEEQQELQAELDRLDDEEAAHREALPWWKRILI